MSRTMEGLQDEDVERIINAGMTQHGGGNTFLFHNIKEGM